MRLSRFAAGAVLALGLAAAGAAHANTVVLNEVLDLTTPQDNGGGAFTAGWRGFGSFSPSFAFDLAEGDTLDYTIQFLGGQSLTLQNFSFAWAISYTDVLSDFDATGAFSFLDANGNALFTSSQKTDVEGVVHIGQNFGAGDFAGLPTTLTFQGVRYQGTVNDYLEPGVTTRRYNDPQLLFSADSAVVATAPEPAAWALMIIGFLGTGVALRARRGSAPALA